MKRNLLWLTVLSAFILPGCFQEEYRQTLAQWQTWRESFARGDLVGKTYGEIEDVWGLPNEIQHSIIGKTHIHTVTYTHKGYDPEWNAIVPVETYHLIFVNGSLDACHKF